MDTISPERRSENMRRIQSKGMKPEVRVRSLVHRLGYRFRLHRKGLPGHPDIVLSRHRKTIFVHGCFWHQHDDPQCRIARIPKSRTDYWIPKLRRNVERDRKHLEALRESGWSTLVVWECQTADEGELEPRLVRFLES